MQTYAKFNHVMMDPAISEKQYVSMHILGSLSSLKIDLRKVKIKILLEIKIQHYNDLVITRLSGMTWKYNKKNLKNLTEMYQRDSIVGGNKY